MSSCSYLSSQGDIGIFGNAVLTGRPRCTRSRFACQGTCSFPVGTALAQCDRASFYLPFSDWRSSGRYSSGMVLDPRLAPLWTVALVGGWVNKNSKVAGTRGWSAAFGLLAVLNVALYWVFIPYRTQQRSMRQALGLAAVPLALLLDRWRLLCLLAAILLGMHLLTPECWPFVGSGGPIPWDMSAAVPNAVDAVIPLPARLEYVWGEHRSDSAFLSLASLGAILVMSIFVSWACCRISPSRSSVHGPSVANRALAATAVFLGLGYMDVWLDLKAEPSSFRKPAVCALLPGMATFGGRIRPQSVRAWLMRAPTFLTTFLQKACATTSST